MESKELIARYVYAVTRSLPEKTRADVGKELNGAIEDMLQERGGTEPYSLEETRIVLRQFGNPQDLAEKYSDSRVNALIGAPYYRIYLKVLKIVLPAVGGALVLAGLVKLMTQETALTFMNILGGIQTLFSALMMVFAYATLIFAILYRKGVDLDEKEDYLDTLPEVPKISRKVSRWAALPEVIWAMLILGFFVIGYQFNIPVISDESRFALFNPEVLVAIRPFFLAVIFMALLKAALLVLAESVHDTVLTVASLLSNLASALLTIFWMSSPQVFNPAVVSHLLNHIGEAEASVLFLQAGMLPRVIMIIVLLILAVDSTVILFRAFRKSN